MSIATAIVGTLVDPISNLLSEFIVDKDKQAEISYKIATMAEQNAHAQVIAQLEINKAEAASESLFKGGWRPACGLLAQPTSTEKYDVEYEGVGTIDDAAYSEVTELNVMASGGA